MHPLLSSLGSLIFLFTLLVNPVHGQQIVVDAFGDSITSGYPYWTSNGNGCYPPCGGYEPELQRLLRSSNPEAAVRNYGVRGDTSTSGLQRIDAVMAASNPKYILLMEGTNEIYFLSPLTVKTNMSLMVDKALARGVIPIIGTITPDSRYPSKPIGATNALLIDLAKQKGVPLSDQYEAAAYRWSSISYTDGIHPNLTGYKIMAQTWFDTLVAAEQQYGSGSTSFLPAIYQLLLSD